MLVKHLLHNRNALRQTNSSQTFLSKLIQLSQFGIKTQTKTIPTQASENSEDFDSLLMKMKITSVKKDQNDNSQQDQKLTQSQNDQQNVQPFVMKQKDDVVYIQGTNPAWRYLSPISIGSKNIMSINLAMYEDRAIALLLRKQSALGQAVNNQNENNEMKQEFKFGEVTNIFGKHIQGANTSNLERYNVDISKGLKQTTFARDIVEKQLYSGHMRIDIANPLTQGNVIVFKGERNLGKSRTAISVVDQFLKEDKNNRAIYVGMSQNQSSRLFESISDNQKSQFVCFTVGGDETAISNAEYLLAPKVALQFGQEYLSTKSNEQKNLLFVFDDVLQHHFKEKHIFDLASQPFSPINIVNEIMENTGVFKNKNTTVTSILIVDTDSSSMMFQKDEQTFINHIDSISDQILHFNNEGNKMLRAYMPLIDLKSNKSLINYWQSPYLRTVNLEIQEMLSELNKAQDQHALRKQLKMDEDPWDNYLVYDSKQNYEIYRNLYFNNYKFTSCHFYATART